MVRPINVPHAPMIDTPSKLNKSLTQDLMEEINSTMKIVEGEKEADGDEGGKNRTVADRKTKNFVS